jgi:hypothetical protein
MITDETENVKQIFVASLRPSVRKDTLIMVTENRFRKNVFGIYNEDEVYFITRDFTYI